MEVYVARQPILNTNQEVMAYELLYRGGKEQNSYSFTDGDFATSEVVTNSFYNMGVERISEGKSCFVNFTANLLKSQFPFCFPPETLVIEILENIEITDELVVSCKALKEKGYRIALDDYVLYEDNPYTYELLKYTDIVKIDVLQHSRQQEVYIFDQLKHFNLTWLAEKVETYEQFQTCKALGYELFQGYFFSKPHIVTAHDVPMYPFQHYQLIEELSKQEPEVHKIAEKIEMDVSLSYKFLRLINTVAYRRLEPVKSIQQAIVLLGFTEIKKWAYVIAMKDIKSSNADVSSEVMKISLTRAKFSENVALEMGEKKEASSYFLTGMLSLIDAVMQQPIATVVNDLPLHDDIKGALLGERNAYRLVLDLCHLIENAQWEEIERTAINLGLSMEKLFDHYHSSMLWCQTMMATYDKQRTTD
ncbi:HDOD domain-containing protein [Pontibacillus yanchengensis]|uniref:HDOD domain-containing protein n=1 Tax=Pontibacillus yanchengensis TaxID=462910 RepID=A0A6I5A1Y9_9BACI|nr:HDOD domain-containing protein [Pontibacillus yanchengensis]MYL34593.1 HDOD domain-containing protein [Pontibacillus yanchengensis]